MALGNLQKRLLRQVKVVNGKALEVRLRETVQEKEKRIHLQDPFLCAFSLDVGTDTSSAVNPCTRAYVRKNWFPQSGGGSGSDGNWWSQFLGLTV